MDDDDLCLDGDDSAFSMKCVLEVENIEIKARREKLAIEDKPNQVLGLTFSGGGIRSATFNLGILQRLAECGVLKHVDYLSTVSGGGYIGSWLCSWIRREQTKQKNESGQLPATETANHGSKLTSERIAFEKVRCSLSVNEPADAPDQAKMTRTQSAGEVEAKESPKITFLRQYSNYLSPRVSVFSADTWVISAIWLRNTLLNLAMLIALIAAVILSVRGLGLLLHHALALEAKRRDWILNLTVSASLLIPVVELIARNLWSNAAISSAAATPTEEASGENTANASRNGEQKEYVVVRFCFFALLSAVAYSVWLAYDTPTFIDGGTSAAILPNFLALLPGFLVVQTCAFRIRTFDMLTERAFAIVGYSSVSALVTAALLRGVAFIFAAFYQSPQQPWFVLTFGPPLVLLALTLGIVVHIGLLGRDLPESCREWLGRLGAWLTIFQAAWIFVVGISIYGPWLVALIWNKSTAAAATLGTGWIVTTVAGLLAGNSAKTGGKDQSETPTMRQQALEIAARIGPYIFMLGFLLLVALGAHAILIHGLDHYPQTPTPNVAPQYDLQHQYDQVVSQSWDQALRDTGIHWMYDWYWWHLGATEWLVSDHHRWFLSGLGPLLALVVVAGFLLALRVDVNLFSLHNFYKNRLIRCYLGASRQRERTPSPFTGFDDLDDTLLEEFRTAKGYYGPYPILNATLNVTSGGKLQYQERQAESFIFTPNFSGFSADTVANAMRLEDSTTTTLRGYQENNQHQKPKAYRLTKTAGGGDITLGMAMAVSGAAVNPNMGYHTSTAVSFLLSIFNVRLGWWLGNALKDSSFKDLGPRFGLRYALLELFGMANANSSYVNLSDGGHFDNMGIYELVRRRCRYIICCDAEADEQLRFDGIANAIRKCRTDFAVDIDLPLQQLAKKEGFSGAHCVVGRINYPADSGKPGLEGYILYLKATITGDESTDVLNYRVEAPEFPHQSTADQWFDESQFESYRKLGHHIAEKALSGQTIDAASKEHFFESLYQIWYPASPDLEEHSAAHADIYNSIFDAIRRDHNLEFLDKDLFEGFAHKPTHGASFEWDHNTGHVCNSLIQLMERVFYDLRLEDEDNQEHPFVAGWIEIFSHWVQSYSFRKAWLVTQHSYPNRFRVFYDRLARKHRKRSAAASNAE